MGLTGLRLHALGAWVLGDVVRRIAHCPSCVVAVNLSQGIRIDIKVAQRKEAQDLAEQGLAGGQPWPGLQVSFINTFPAS